MQVKWTFSVTDEMLQQILETDCDFVVVESENNLLLVRQSFLDKFNAKDGIELADELAYSNWGGKHVFPQQQTQHSILFHSFQGMRLPEGWRCKHTDLGLDKLQTQIKKAKEYRRQIYVTVTYL